MYRRNHPSGRRGVAARPFQAAQRIFTRAPPTGGIRQREAPRRSRGTGARGIEDRFFRGELAEAGKLLQALDGYVNTPTDDADIERQWPQLKALFLIDRDGIVRWSHIECVDEGLAGIGKFPSEQAILGAARACAA